MPWPVAGALRLPRLAKLGRILEDGLDTLKRAADAGVRIAFGTDLLGPLHEYQPQEFAIRAQVLPMRDVIKSATVMGAELLGLDGEVGRVAPGYRADLIVVDGDPSSDTTPLADPKHNLRAVMRDGVVIHSSIQ